MMLEDLVSFYKRPSIVDLKMGTRQHGDDATVQKQLRLFNRCNESTSKEFGVRMVGMQLYDANSKHYLYINKYEGRTMDHISLKESLKMFFSTAGPVRTNNFIRKLNELREILVGADGFRFFSSSLLIAFEGREETSDVILRMIDFAHSTFNGFMNDKSYSGPDNGYILGIDTLLGLLQERLDPVIDDNKFTPSKKILFTPSV